MAKQKCQSSFPQRYWSYTHWTPIAGVISLECHGQDHGARWWWHGAKPWFGLAKLQSFFLCRKNLDVFGRWSSFFWRLTHPLWPAIEGVAISIQVQDMDELDWKQIEGQEVPAQAVKRAAPFSHCRMQIHLAQQIQIIPDRSSMIRYSSLFLGYLFGWLGGAKKCRIRRLRSQPSWSWA